LVGRVARWCKKAGLWQGAVLFSGMDRRRLFAGSGAALAGLGAVGLGRASGEEKAGGTGPAPFRFCFNTSTIRGQELAIEDEIELVGKAGYDGIELWMNKIQSYVEGGGELAELRKRLDDHGLVLESAIGFAQWIVDDEAARAEGLETAKRDMDAVAQLGGRRIAAPPAGATKDVRIDLFAAAERYRALLGVGREMGVVPMVELWGFSENLSRLGEVAFVAVEAADPDSEVLTDVYHIYKGGSEFQGLRMLRGMKMPVLHINDYPATPGRAEIGDADRIWPGDGVAPIGEVLDIFREGGGGTVLSLELFNREYWAMPAGEVVKIGLEKTRAVVGV